jgi:hypothetical protein
MELVVTGQSDQPSPGRRQREEDLYCSILPYLRDRKSNIKDIEITGKEGPWFYSTGKISFSVLCYCKIKNSMMAAMID